jgi:hypothetical protein
LIDEKMRKDSLGVFSTKMRSHAPIMAAIS